LSLESLITTYGYWAILAGTFLEGETVLVLGGFSAHQGYLVLPWVIAAAFAGSFANDQLFFFIGRWKGRGFISGRPALKQRADKVHRLLERYKIPVILGFRFVYGFRMVTPLVLGSSKVKSIHFILLDMIAALVWATLVGAGGYFFGTAIEAIIGDIKSYELKIMLGLAVIGAVIWLFRYFRKRDRSIREK